MGLHRDSLCFRTYQSLGYTAVSGQNDACAFGQLGTWYIEDLSAHEEQRGLRDADATEIRFAHYQFAAVYCVVQQCRTSTNQYCYFFAIFLITLSIVRAVCGSPPLGPSGLFAGRQP